MAVGSAEKEAEYCIERVVTIGKYLSRRHGRIERGDYERS